MQMSWSDLVSTSRTYQRSDGPPHDLDVRRARQVAVGNLNDQVASRAAARVGASPTMSYLSWRRQRMMYSSRFWSSSPDKPVARQPRLVAPEIAHRLQIRLLGGGHEPAHGHRRIRGSRLTGARGDRDRLGDGDGVVMTTVFVHAPARTSPMITFFIRSSPVTSSVHDGRRPHHATEDCPHDPSAPLHQHRPHRDHPPSASR